MHFKKITLYFTKGEWLLLSGSLFTITICFLLFDRQNYVTLAASVIGATSLLYNAKGKPFGQLLMIVFSILYGAISYDFHYYGEMVTYLGMTGPMALFALISWLRNPFSKENVEVRVNRLKPIEWLLAILLTSAVTAVFSFILAYFHTAYLTLSTLSVATSFLAAYLTCRRSAYFPLAYAANDIVLIVLWILAARSDIGYLSVIICFAIFLVNDFYGFLCWKRMERRQRK